MAKILKLLILFCIVFLGNSHICANTEKILNIPLHATKISLDPTGVQDLSSLFVSRQVNCQLIREQGSVYTLEAAQSIKYISPLTVVIKINPSAKFHDNTPVTAVDVIASFNHIKQSRNTLRNIFSWIKSIKQNDMYTITINLNKPIPQFLKVLASPNYAIFKSDFLNDAIKDRNLWEKPLGCGKYKVLNSTPDAIHLIPIAKGYPVQFYLNQRNQLSSDEIQKYDISDLHLSDSTADLRDYKAIELFDPTQIYIGLNTKKTRWKNRSNRCAFLKKINPDVILQSYAGLGRKANDFFPMGVLGYEKDSDYMSKNKINSNDKIMPVNESFCLSYLALSIPEKFRAAYVEVIQRIYPNVSLKPLDQAKHFGPDFIKMNCDALLVGLKSNYLDGYEYLLVLSEKNVNYTGYVDERLAKEIRFSQTIADADTRSRKYRNIVAKIEQQCLIRPLITIPMRTVYIKKSLITPGIGIGPLNEYDLSVVR